MRIDASMMTQQATRTGAVKGMLDKIYEKLATGKRINRASDDAAGLAVAKELEKSARGYRQAGANIGDAMSALKIADGATQEISSMLQRQRELAVQSSNDTLNSQDREALDKEYQALTEEIDRVAQATQFNRQSLLDGQSALSDGTGLIQVGSAAGDQMQLDASNFRSASLGVGGSIASATGARTAIDGIDRAMQSVNEGRSTLGARINRLETAYANGVQTEINTTASQSLLEDLDFAQGLMEKSRVELLSMSSIQAQRHFGEISRSSVMALLR